MRVSCLITTKALGLDVPPIFVTRAEGVIEQATLFAVHMARFGPGSFPGSSGRGMLTVRFSESDPQATFLRVARRIALTFINDTCVACGHT
jgi:hypothetical protein